ncbi:hypothetical protein NQ318_004709 [Aromia moschata]|uniref:PiggyBac transposable element-derived protein domain-containing protein n=1 Tax=Aromia moschata TaxID=1265417 RepID=A0AAV8X2E2_9CUCU|nr:hypothetical protein NQ318_004709 [Aromia moschata]
MYVRPYNMKITGTIRKNKPDIPNEMKIGSKEVPASSFCHSGDVTLVSYKPKKNKIVLLVSTKMTKFNIGEARKPEMILFYNKTKGGTDTFDKLCHAYTTARATNRWPMRFFFGMLDQAFKLRKNSRADAIANKSPQATIKSLVFHLITPYMRQRLQNNTLRIDLRRGIGTILGISPDDMPEEERPKLLKRARCASCSSSKDKKTQIQCPSCKLPMCDDHRIYLCNTCGGCD